MFPYEAYDVAIRNTYCMSPYEATSTVGMLDIRCIVQTAHYISPK